MNRCSVSKHDMLEPSDINTINSFTRYKQNISDNSSIFSVFLKLIQEYARISLLNFIIFNKDKRELIKLLDLAQIDDASFKKN